ncbi:alpha/beta hydrolase family protein [Actinomyces sp. oral taxon 897]|uniref:alpha/beta hydrolase family protein n=1 Tax=Actinomyces sp. oral taxon 897 TaxID=2081702 RepID=UPI000D03C5DD|nr:alpha/beta fold hydrolase [Actinomyces sp. oral taxon 897]AVM61619.1 feruloyl esterase [Actinomyces sp. oral taxon 897]
MTSPTGRRAVLRALGATGAATLLGAVAACASGPGSEAETAPASDAASPGSTPDAASPGSSAPAPQSTLPTYAYETRDLDVTSQGQTLPGRLYVPAADAAVPLVICSHGLCSAPDDVAPVAQALARLGLAAYCPSFRGGGPGSVGDMTRMSVMTEVADLEAVLTAARTATGGWEVVDPGRIVLLGESQGGEVSAVTAARHPEQVAGLVLWYPAFSITDTLHSLYTSLDAVPQDYSFLGCALGRVYAQDMWDYDVYTEIAGYTAPVLIVHGSDDLVVPYRYSERARTTYPDAELVRIDGAGHGFDEGPQEQQAMAATVSYLQRIGVMKA